jgi:large subunit ribosomal protein L23
MKNAHTIIQSQLITERGAELAAEGNQYLFRVSPDANKIEVKKAIEHIFKVKVLSVRTMNRMGKIKRRGAHVGRKSAWKKAVVRLKAGEKISIT